MKILVIGATGMIGRRVAAEAASRGHEVTRATRSGADGTSTADAGDAGAVAALAAGCDGVVLSVPPPREDPQPSAALLTVGRGVLGGLRQAGVSRLVVAGEAGTPEVAPGVRLIDTPQYPAAYRSVGLAQAALLDLLRFRRSHPPRGSDGAGPRHRKPERLPRVRGGIPSGWTRFASPPRGQPPRPTGPSRPAAAPSAWRR